MADNDFVIYTDEETFQVVVDDDGIQVLIDAVGFDEAVAAQVAQAAAEAAQAAAEDAAAEAAASVASTQPLDADLSALAANSTNGLWARTGPGTGAARTLTGTASEITITNGSGAAGNPVFSLPNALDYTGKTVTGGTFSSGLALPTGASTPRTFAAHFADTINVKDFGATGDGVADDTAEIQAALDTGKPVYFPAGYYLVSSALNILTHGQMVYGAGVSNTWIRPNYASGNVFNIGNGTDGLIGVRITNIGVSKDSTAMSGGSMIRVGKNCANITIDHFFLHGGYNGVEVQGGGTSTTTKIQNFYIETCANHGIKLGDTVGVATDVWVSHGTIALCANGLTINAVSGGFFSDIDALLCTNNGINIDVGATYPAVFMFFDRVLGDSSTNYGWSVASAGGKIAGVDISHSWAAGNGLDGIILNTSNINGLRISGCQIRGNQHHGISYAAGTNVYIENNQILHNSAAGSGTYHGVSITAGVSDFVVSGNLSGRGGYDYQVGGTNFQGYGILLNAGASDRYMIKDNRCPNNITGGTSDGGSGINKTVSNNVAW